MLVHEFAKEIGTDSASVLEACEVLGLPIENHMQKLNDEQEEEITRYLSDPDQEPDPAEDIDQGLSRA